MQRCGWCWNQQSGNEILQLRALQLSDRWDAAMPRIRGPLHAPVHVVASRAQPRCGLKHLIFSQNRVFVVRSRTMEKTCDLTIYS